MNRKASIMVLPLLIISIMTRAGAPVQYADKDVISFFGGNFQPDSCILTYPRGEIFSAGKFKRLLLGNNYREEWVTPVEIQVFDFTSEHGKMKIVDIGGNAQTRTLRLEDEVGKQWVLRSIDKDPAKVIPEQFRTEIAEDIVLDQMSASLPWAALAVPRMADAAGVYHTNPRVVYLSAHSLPEQFKTDWEGMYLFEERPDGDCRDVASLGNARKIISTGEMLKDVASDPEYFVDQEFLLKARLLDMLISDWDRHEDQWRWAAFKDKGKTVYRAIPRDRDMAFFVNEGVLPWLSSRKFLLRKTQGLDYEIKDFGGLNFNARHLDRRFLNELSRENWKVTANRLQIDLSDEIIEKAVNDMPPEIARISGNNILSKLKARRDNLEAIAVKYYAILADKVDIVGTDKSEMFTIIRVNDEKTLVTVHSLGKKGKVNEAYYKRVFIHSETSEINLYGLDGQDVFFITGNVAKGIKIRIIGGKGKDDITDESRVSGVSKKTWVYDDPEETILIAGNETRNPTSLTSAKTTYRYDAFNYNKFLPLIFTGYNTDDGVLFGGGFIYTTHGFNKYPFATRNRLTTQYSLATKALELNYSGTYTRIFNNMDLGIQFHFRDPKYTQNYFGLGNETEKSTEDKDYYRVRIGEIYINPEISYPFNARTRFSGGMFYLNSQIEATPGRYISDFAVNDLDPEIFEHNEFVGVTVRFSHDSRDNPVFPTQGIFWEAGNQFYHELSSSKYIFNRLRTQISVFLNSKEFPSVVAAFRLGGAINSGNSDLSQSNSLGGRYNLRGYRDSRFSGYASLFQNTELRIKLSGVKSYLTRGYFGILLFNDFGRVWHKGEDSQRWHHGYGGGLWVSPYEMTIITLMYEKSADERSGLVSLRLGFLF